MERKLASIQQVIEISPIEGADFIERARVMGWDAVVKKGEFKPGDSCVFFEIDSVLPEAPWSEFLGDNRRIKTKRLRGVLSQGLALPIAILDREFPVGEDVTEALGVTKHEPVMVSAAGKTVFDALPFPYDVPKTDEIRIQSALGVLEELYDLPYTITEKLDGTSVTAFWDGEKLVVCSRNYQLKPENGGREWAYALSADLESKLKNFRGMVFQGELCGPGIQKNRLNLDTLEWFIFSAYDRLQHTYLPMGMEIEAELAQFGLRTVPVLERGAFFRYSLDQLLEKAKGLYTGTKNRREGIVVRPQIEMHSRTLQGRMSFKVLNNEFLLKDED